MHEAIFDSALEFLSRTTLIRSRYTAISSSLSDGFLTAALYFYTSKTILVINPWPLQQRSRNAVACSNP